MARLFLGCSQRAILSEAYQTNPVFSAFPNHNVIIRECNELAALLSNTDILKMGGGHFEVVVDVVLYCDCKLFLGQC